MERTKDPRLAWKRTNSPSYPKKSLRKYDETDREQASFYYPILRDVQLAVPVVDEDPGLSSHAFTPSFFIGEKKEGVIGPQSNLHSSEINNQISECRSRCSNHSLNMATAIPDYRQSSMSTTKLEAGQPWRISEHSFSAMNNDESEVYGDEMADDDLLSSRVSQLKKPSSCQEFYRHQLGDPFLFQKKSPFQDKSSTSNSEELSTTILPNSTNKINQKSQSLHYPLEDFKRNQPNSRGTGDQNRI